MGQCNSVYLNPPALPGLVCHYVDSDRKGATENCNDKLRRGVQIISKQIISNTVTQSLASKTKDFSISPPASSLTLSLPIALCFNPVRYCLNDHVPWHESAI